MLLMNLTDMFDRAMLGVKDLTFDMKEVSDAVLLKPLSCYRILLLYGVSWSDVTPRSDGRVPPVRVAPVQLGFRPDGRVWPMCECQYSFRDTISLRLRLICAITHKTLC